MERWHGFRTALNVAQTYETTILDSASDLSAHFVTVPARSLGGESYLFEEPDWPLEALGLVRMADIPLGGVARSLAACLASRNAEEFLRRFNESFEESNSDTLSSGYFAFAEYLTFARVVPFEWSSVSLDSLGSVLTAQGYGEAGYMYHEDTETPMLAAAIPAGIVICGSAPKMIGALEAGLRREILAFIKRRSTEERARDEGR